MNTFQLIIFGMLTGIVTGEFVERKTTQRPTIYFYRWYYLPPGRHVSGYKIMFYLSNLIKLSDFIKQKKSYI